MRTKPTEVEVLESSEEKVKVKLPYMEIPMEISHELFKDWLTSGYFILIKNTEAKQVSEDPEYLLS